MNLPKKLALIFIVTLMASNTTVIEQKNKLLGKWKMIRSEITEIIMESPAYFVMPEEQQDEIRETFEEVVNNTYYNFVNDTLLIYDSFENKSFVKRKAKWKIENGYLYIDELERPFKREAKLNKLDAESFSFSPIVEGKVGHQIIFRRVEE